MTISTTDVPAYTDLNGLSSLKRGVATQDPAAIRKVAQQFESLFTRMMLKSMRDATGKDPIFGSDQEQMYQSMADDQLSVQLSKGKGLGIADMLIRQLQKLGVPGAAAASGTTVATGGDRAAAAYSAVKAQSTSATLPASPAAQSSFIRGLWPQAQQAAEQLGVDPRTLLAQAALESNWGRNLPQGGSGQSSNNLFGIKAGSDWTGNATSATTQEFQGGTAGITTARFRTYANAAASFQDYVALLREQPRYAAALNTGSDVQAFAAGLQRGGYATDPDYVQKLSATAQSVAASLARDPAVMDLKSAGVAPITTETGAL